MNITKQRKCMICGKFLQLGKSICFKNADCMEKAMIKMYPATVFTPISDRIVAITHKEGVSKEAVSQYDFDKRKWISLK